MHTEKIEAELRDAIKRFDEARARLDALDSGAGAGDEENNRAVAEWKTATRDLAGAIVSTKCEAVFSGGKTYAVLSSPGTECDGQVAVIGSVYELTRRGVRLG
jgi:hypothetical protein